MQSEGASAEKAPNIYATVEEFAERVKVGRTTVFAWLKRGLPSVSVGRTRRILTDKADAWLAAGGADAVQQRKRSIRTKRTTD